MIEDGRLTCYLYDLRDARAATARSPTGNGRRESFRHLPIPRMTNTYFAPGDATPEELIGEIERGLYAVSFGGGQVEPATGDFVFGVSEGYLIEGGKVTAPVRGATLVGNGRRGAARRSTAIAGDLDIASGYLRQGRAVRAGRRRPAARAHPRADRRRHRREPRRRLRAGAPSRPPRDAGATDAEAWAEEATSARIRVYEGEVESLSDAGRPRRGRARLRRTGARATPTARTSRTRAWPRSPAPRGRPPRWPTPTSTAGLPDEFGATPVDGLASPALRDWSTERKVELALAVERAARARDRA